VVTKVEDSMTVDGPKLKKEYPDIYGEVTKKKSGFRQGRSQTASIISLCRASEKRHRGH